MNIMANVKHHRYRFWFLFPTGDMIENHFIIPGKLDNRDADTLATAYWVRSIEEKIGRLPTPDGLRTYPGVGKVLDATLARTIINGASFEVMRPGELY